MAEWREVIEFQVSPETQALSDVRIYQYYCITVSLQHHTSSQVKFSMKYHRCMISGCWFTLAFWNGGGVHDYFASERYVLRHFSGAFAAFSLWNR